MSRNRAHINGRLVLQQQHVTGWADGLASDIGRAVDVRGLACHVDAFGDDGRMTYTVHQLAEINRQVVAAFDARERRPWTLETVMIEPIIIG
jgi:hypothetical protein